MAMGHVYGPLMPIDSDKVFIQCGWEKHYWIENPLYIFDDTLIHRSVNDYEARRHAVFMDIMRPTPFPGMRHLRRLGDRRAHQHYFLQELVAAWRQNRPASSAPFRSGPTGPAPLSVASDALRPPRHKAWQNQYHPEDCAPGSWRAGAEAQANGGFPHEARYFYFLINPFRSMHEI